MHFDFSQVDDTDSYVSVPPGVYDCRVAEVRPGRSRDGSERWSMRLEVVTGEYAGRTAAWDALTWSERGVRRVKQVLALFGFDVSGELNLQPADLQGRHIRATVQPEEWEDPITGKRQLNNRVPYMGYDPAEVDPAEVDLDKLEPAQLQPAGSVANGGAAGAAGASAADASRSAASSPEDDGSFESMPF